MKKMLIALSLSGALLGGSVAWAEEAVTASAASEDVTVVETADTSLTNSELAAAPAPAEATAAPVEEEVKLDTGDTAWILVSTALVLLMTIPGLALFYGGMVRKKNVLGTMAHSFVAAAVVSITWVVIGYSLAFGEGNAFIGSLDKIMLSGITTDALTGTIPEILFVIFQMTFAIITVAIITGSIAERMKFSAFVAFITIWSVVVYAPITHWVWGGGWLGNDGALDFAGGTVVHINSGVAGLVAAYMLGKRMGLGRESMAPHNLTLTVIGASLVWVGWFGFNGGSALGANGSAGYALVVTQVAAAAAAIAWLITEKVVRGKASVLGGASGAVAGLVVITPAAGFVTVGGARTVGDDDVVGGQGVVVDLVDDGLVGIVAGGRDQDALGPRLQVGLGLVTGGEDAGALKGDVDVQVLVRQVGRIAFGRDLDLAQAHVDPFVAALDRAGKTAVDRIVAQQVRIGRHRPQVVDRHNLDVAAALLGDGAKNKAADAAEAVDGDADGHGEGSSERDGMTVI